MGIRRWDMDGMLEYSKRTGDVIGAEVRPYEMEKGSYVLFTDHEQVVAELKAEVDALLDVLAPFAHFAMVRSGLGSMSPKGDGVVYAVHSSVGEAELTANDFEAAFDSIARNTEDK